MTGRLRSSGTLSLEHGSLRAFVVPDDDTDARRASAELWHRAYVDRGWIPDGRAGDNYDAVSAHLAVSDGQAIIATLRNTPHVAGCGFMLENEFAALVDDPASIVRNASSVEVSRLAVTGSDPAARVQSLLLLCRLWFRLVVGAGCSRAYFVMNDAFLPTVAPFDEAARLFLKPLGPWRQLGPGRPCRAYSLDVRMAARTVRDVAPGLAPLLGL